MGHRIKIGPYTIQDGVGHGTTWMMKHIGIELEQSPISCPEIRNETKRRDGLVEAWTLLFPEGSEWVRRPKERDRRKSDRDSMGSIVVYAHGNRYLCTFREAGEFSLPRAFEPKKIKGGASCHDEA